MTDLNPDQALKKPQQRRSEASLQRMLAAAEELLNEGTFEEATIGEIVRRSNTSVGAFYNRFADKAALLKVLEDRFFEDVLRRFEAFFEGKRLHQMSLEGAVRAVVEEITRLYRNHLGLVRALAIESRSRLDADQQQQGVKVNRALYDWSAKLILDRRQEIRHPDPSVAVPFAISMAAATLREHILFGQAKLSPILEEGQVCEEVIRAVTVYLQGGESSTSELLEKSTLSPS